VIGRYNAGYKSLRVGDIETQLWKTIANVRLSVSVLAELPIVWADIAKLG